MVYNAERIFPCHRVFCIDRREEILHDAEHIPMRIVRYRLIQSICRNVDFHAHPAAHVLCCIKDRTVYVRVLRIEAAVFGVCNARSDEAPRIGRFLAFRINLFRSARRGLREIKHILRLISLCFSVYEITA